MPAHIRHGARRDPHQRQTRIHNIHEVSLPAVSSRSHTPAWSLRLTTVWLDPVRVKCLLHFPPLSSTGCHFTSPPPPGLGEPAPAAPPIAQSATVTSTTTRSSVTTHTSLTDPVTGEEVCISHPAWTGGREEPDIRLLPPTWEMDY